MLVLPGSLPVGGCFKHLTASGPLKSQSVAKLSVTAMDIVVSKSIQKLSFRTIKILNEYVTARCCHMYSSND